MPPDGGAARAEQLATLQGMAHERMISEQLQTLLSQSIDLATGDPLPGEQWDPAARGLLREIWRDYQKAKKLPTDFVMRFEKEASLSQQVWVQARAKSDFSIFGPHLQTLVGLKREEATYLQYKGSPYNALLDDYEPGASVEGITPLFSSLRAQLVPLLERIRRSRRGAKARLRGPFDEERQLDFGRMILDRMGFNFREGRLDLSAHPFTTQFHPSDVRLTTRVSRKDPGDAIFSCLHEGGHGLYDQGLPKEYYGTPLGEPVSLGIHESQSRLWENCVGRSRDFWSYFFPKLKKQFPGPLRGVDLDLFYRSINRVRPSLIRVDADELTYNLHIMLRYDLERGMIDEGVDIGRLPALWNDGMERYLGIRPRSDRDGVLQDVHWSIGAIGYFPTYTLGNLYAVQLFRQAHCEIPGLSRKIERGSLSGLKKWLNEKIHRWGRLYSAAELIEQVTHEPLNPGHFMRYLEEKFGEVYRL